MNFDLKNVDVKTAVVFQVSTEYSVIAYTLTREAATIIANANRCEYGRPAKVSEQPALLIDGTFYTNVSLIEKIDVDYNASEVIRRHAISKLTEEERKVLGLS